MSQSKSNTAHADPITLTGSEVKVLNHSFTDAGIKWLAMYKGLWAEVLEMKNGLLVLAVTYPKNSTERMSPETLVGILCKCRAWDELGIGDGLWRIYVIQSTDIGSAGRYQHVDEFSQEEWDQMAKESAAFGETSTFRRDWVFDRDEIVGMG
jgi:hypothetical protein